MTSLAKQILAGNRRAIARQISHIENQTAAGQQAVADLFPHTGQAHLIGVTGPPGSGKSTLVNQLARQYRSQQKTVAILAIDPTSPFSGGALLGDRIRLQDLAGDAGVFVRSMATRGHLGGLAQAAAAAVTVFDAAGFEVILIETVGVGQAEVEIASLAHTVLVVDVPGLGDEVQAIKAGLLEIADIFVINKADRPGVDQTEAALKMMQELAQPQQPTARRHHGQLMAVAGPDSETPAPTPSWLPPLRRTIATTGKGVNELTEAVQAHREHQAGAAARRQRERERFGYEIEERLKTRLLADLLATVGPERLTELIDQVAARKLSPQTAVDKLLQSE